MDMLQDFNIIFRYFLMFQNCLGLWRSLGKPWKCNVHCFYFFKVGLIEVVEIFLFQLISLFKCDVNKTFQDENFLSALCFHIPFHIISLDVCIDIFFKDPFSSRVLCKLMKISACLQGTLREKGSLILCFLLSDSH